MRRIRISVFGKDYELLSESSEDVIDYVYRKLKDLQANYKSIYEEVSFDELLVIMLCDVIENEYIVQKRLSELVERLRERIKSLEGDARR